MQSETMSAFKKDKPTPPPPFDRPKVDRIIRPKIAAREYLSVSMATFYRLVRAGKISLVSISEGTRGIRESELIRYMESLKGTNESAARG